LALAAHAPSLATRRWARATNNVVFLKAPGYQDGDAGYCSPLDEQVWLADTISTIEMTGASPIWSYCHEDE